MDYFCINLMKFKITDIFSKMTTNLWKEHKEKINAAQVVLNHKQEQSNANKEVAMNLDTEQTVNTTQLSYILDKMLNNKLT